MAGVDSTPYTADARPDQTLRLVLHTASVPEAFRVRLAEVGVLTNDAMAQAFVQNIKALFTGHNPFGEAPQSIIVEAKLVSSWRKSRALMEETDSKRSKLMEDPHMIPEIPIHEYNSNRANFVTRHPDVLVVDYKDPHKKFLERLIRDLIVNEVVLPYRLEEIRLLSEDVVQKPGLSPTAEMLLKISQEEVPATVTAEDDATNRIHG